MEELKSIKMLEEEKVMKKVLLKDIVIPKGTVFNRSPITTERYGEDHFECVIGLSKNTSGFLEYCIDSNELDEYFTDLKE